MCYPCKCLARYARSPIIYIYLFIYCTLDISLEYFTSYEHSIFSHIKCCILNAPKCSSGQLYFWPMPSYLWMTRLQSFGMEILVKKVVTNIMMWMCLNRVCILSCSELHSARCISRTLHNSSSYPCYIYLHNCKTMQETEEEWQKKVNSNFTAGYFSKYTKNFYSLVKWND